MLTIFTIPKAFTDKHINLIQRKAIRSWLALRPRCEVVLVGDDSGVAKAAKELKVKHIAKVARNQFNTPLVNSAFGSVRKMAKNNILGFINADIILRTDLKQVFKHLPEKDFLIVGRRTQDTQKHLRGVPTERRGLLGGGELASPEAIDYFIFPKESFKNLPPFAVGRAGWDNWMIYEARRKKMMTIDVTSLITAIHQTHDYAHQVDQGENRQTGPEAKKNLELAAGMGHIFTIEDTERELTKDGLKKKKFNLIRFLKYLKFNPEVLPGKKLFWQPWKSLAGWVCWFLERRE